MRFRRSLAFFLALCVVQAFALTGPRCAAAASDTDKMLALLGTMPAHSAKLIPNSIFDRAGYANDTTCRYYVGSSCDYNATLARKIAGAQGPACEFACWGGGAYDPANKLLYVWGGGHAGYFGSEVYAFNVRKLRWERLTTPQDFPARTQIVSFTNAMPGVATTSTPHGLRDGETVYIPGSRGHWGTTYTATVVDSTHFSINADTTTWGAYNPPKGKDSVCRFRVGTGGQPNSLYMIDGTTPNTTHTYSGLVVAPGYGMFYPHSVQSNYQGCSGAGGGVVLFSSVSRSWSTPYVTNAVLPIPGQGSADALGAYDPSKRLVYWMGSQRSHLYSYDPARNVVAVAGRGMVNGGYHNVSAMAPGGPFVVMGRDAIGPTARPGVEEYATNGSNTANGYSCSANCNAVNYAGPNGQGAAGLVWDAARRYFVSIVPGDNHAYVYHDSTHRWSSYAITGDSVPTEYRDGQGVYGRLAYLPSPYDAYLDCPSHTTDCVVIKP